jgi:hypothetical protein
VSSPLTRSFALLAVVAAAAVVPGHLRRRRGGRRGDQDRHGLLFLCLVPSTVQSSIAFTSIAHGNVPAAIVSASLSNMLGVVLTPLLVVLLMQTSGGPQIDASAVLDIALQLLLPSCSASPSACDDSPGGIAPTPRWCCSAAPRGALRPACRWRWCSSAPEQWA